METWIFKLSICIFIIMFIHIHCQFNPRGTNVCKSVSGIFQCCHGWGQTGDECSIAICEGNFTCKENEVCVRPNECRCRHGYFGATCDMKCPSQYWGPDCKGSCTCHPNGKCDDITGACTCHPNRWGPSCELPCGCQRGTCAGATGICACFRGFWGLRCAGSCRCSGSPCEQLTGRCLCRERSWGARCQHACQCAHGRCNQPDGTCVCGPGFRGRFCREPCPAGSYGQNCRNRCGHCKGQQPCKVADGRCVTCERGWNGTGCDQVCAGGFFGDDCQEACPRCKDGHFCNRIDGKCPHCNPGWMGDRCDNTCPSGSYGENCAKECKDCFNGTCHFVTGQCLCDPGYHGTFCNASCSAGKYGDNCTQTCPCHENNCNPVSGACHLQPNQRMGVIAAGVLVSFLLVLLSCLLCFCYVCKRNSSENKAKRRLCGGLTRITSRLPRVPLRSHKLPNVLVSHHDPENSLNYSFIEPPSTAEQAAGSLRGSYCSDTNGDCAGYAPDENAKVSKKRRDGIKTTILAGDDDDDEEDDNDNDDDGVSDEEASSSESCGVALPTFDNSRRLVCHRTADSEGSCCQYTTTKSEQLNPDQESSGETRNIQENGIDKATEKVKPQPPDPSTKPKVSWIHGTRESSPKQTTPAEITPENRKSSSKKASNKSVPPQLSDGRHKAKTPTEKSRGRNLPGLLPLEQINGAVQNVFKQISPIHVDRKASIPKDSVPTMANSSSGDALQPHIDSEVASMLAAQLKEKTESLSRSQSKSCEDSSQSQTVKKKPTPPQKTVSQAVTSTHLSVEKNPLLASNNSQNGDSPLAEAKSPKIERSFQEGDHSVEKTVIKKPLRKKCQEGHVEPKGKRDL